jgi:hypothetical protein
MEPLAASQELGDGAIYNCLGLWEGVVLRPGPQALTDEMAKRGFESIFRPAEELDGEATDLLGFIRPTRAGLKVIDAFHAIGALGGTAGTVWVSSCTASEFRANLISGSIADFGISMLDTANEAADAASEITDFVGMALRYWPITLGVVVLAWMLVTGKVRLA